MRSRIDFRQLKRVPGEVTHADEGEAGLLHQSYEVDHGDLCWLD